MRYVNYSQIDPTVVLEEAQTLIYSTLRAREMRSVWEFTVGPGAASIALPTGFLDPYGKLRDNFFFSYIPTTVDQLERRRIYQSDGTLDQGQPAFWSIHDEAINFELKFDTTATLRLPYYKQPDLLAASTNETNFLTRRYPHIVRQACVIRSHAFMKNWTGMQAELPLLGPMIERANTEADLSLYAADIDQELYRDCY